MNNENLMKIAVYVWEIRKAANAKALGRDSLEKAIIELEDLRNAVKSICRRCRKPNILTLGATIESLMDMTENDILNRLSEMHSDVYDLAQFAHEA